MNREISAWEPGDPQVEWTGRADGIEDAQLDFSDIRGDGSSSPAGSWVKLPCERNPRTKAEERSEVHEH